jgi:DNA-binding transcriptional ArsR family regulator
MSYWRIGIDELVGSRFTISPLTETVAALTTLAGQDPIPGLRRWADQHRPAYRERLAADPVMDAFVEAGMRPRWMAHLLSLPPQRGDRTFQDELRRLREVPLALARRDLAVGGRLAPPLRSRDLVTRAAELLEWVWTETVRPDWPRRRQIFEADIVTRSAKLGAGGWASALDGMRKGMRWLGDGRLQINAYDNPPRTITGAELLFVPTTSSRGWVGCAEPCRYAITYPCAGMLADEEPPTGQPALAQLIGPVRAQILGALAEPRSTSQLVALSGYGLGSVGRHLKVLRDAGLVQRRRAGRSVLYLRTPLGDRVMASR